MAKQESSSKTVETVWLIKSSETILGPLNVTELAQAVRGKNIGLLDEAKLPGGRWFFVRDIREIQTTISKLAEVEDTMEKTHTAAHTQLTATQNINDDNTPVPPPLPIAHTPVPPVKPVVVSAPPVNTSSNTSDSVPVKSYSANPPADKIAWGRWGMVGFACIAFVIAVFSFAQKRMWESEQKKIWAEFQQYYVAQLYTDAYKKLKEYQKDYPDQPMALTRAAFLYLNPGRELVQAKRLFERSAQLDPNNRELMVQNLNGLGLIALYEGQMSLSKSSFDRALMLEPNSIPTRFNLVSLYMAQGLWKEAFSLTQHLISSEPKKAYLIQSTLSLLSFHFQEQSRNLVSHLERSLDSSSYLRPIMRLLIIKLMSQSGAPGLDVHLKGFFEDLPSLHMEFTESPQIDQRWRDWNFLYQFCSDIRLPSNYDDQLIALKAVCISQIQKWTEAERIIDEGLQRFPNSLKLFQARLHMLTMMGRGPEVRALMKTAQLTSDAAVNWMFAKACYDEKNKSCLDLYLNPLLQRNPISTAVYTLEAQQTCPQEGALPENCRSYLNQGLAQDPLAYDLLKIRFQSESGL